MFRDLLDALDSVETIAKAAQASGAKDGGRACPFCEDGRVYEDESGETPTYSCDNCDHSGYV